MMNVTECAVILENIEDTIMKTIILAAVLFTSGSVMASPPPGQYNQVYTYNSNQQFGSTNWYSSPLGQGAAMAGVAIVSGLVNAMSRPDPVVVVPAPQGNQYAAQQPAQYPGAQSTCRMQTLYDQSGNPRNVKVCD